MKHLASLIYSNWQGDKVVYAKKSIKYSLLLGVAVAIVSTTTPVNSYEIKKPPLPPPSSGLKFKTRLLGVYLSARNINLSGFTGTFAYSPNLDGTVPRPNPDTILKQYSRIKGIKLSNIRGEPVLGTPDNYKKWTASTYVPNYPPYIHIVEGVGRVKAWIPNVPVAYKLCIGGPISGPPTSEQIQKYFVRP